MNRRIGTGALLSCLALLCVSCAGAGRAARGERIDFGWEQEPAGAPLRAFPGAEGGGMYTTGGRGGRVYHVTKLDDDGSEGTLRRAVRAKGPRTIVFDVAGTITLTRELEISHGDLTVAGQTAPGDGICLRGASVVIKADNVIIRYLRFRMGDRDPGGVLDDSSDAIWGRYHQNIILDHCSMSWSIDEVASFYANCNFTMQWCIVSEALSRSHLHSKGAHGFGGLWGGRNASFHHNLLAHNASRNARIDHPGIYKEYLSSHRGTVDLRNNVIYNWGYNTTYGGENGRYNLVGNYYKPGPASKKRLFFVDAYWYNSTFGRGSAYPRLYLADNFHAGAGAEAMNADNRKGVVWRDQSKYGPNPPTEEALLTEPLPVRAGDTLTCPVTTHPVRQAFERVLDWAGASLRRDTVDRRVVADVRAGGAAVMRGSRGSTGGLIDSQEDVGGWPELRATDEEIARAATDSDGDGIPDYYERLFGLDPHDAADAAAATLDPQGRYPNLEVYLHYLVQGITAAQNRL